MLIDLEEPLKLTLSVRVDGRSKTLHEFRQENSLVQHTPSEIDDRVGLMVTRATREIRDSGFTMIELTRVRKARERTMQALNLKPGSKT